jgi:hypothetical protein
MSAVDEFIIGDGFGYSRQSHQNRTPIRRPNGRMWLTVPLEAGSKGVPIRSVMISQGEYDPGRLWRAIRFNYEATPFFIHYADAVRELLFDNRGALGDLTVASTRRLASWLRIETPVAEVSRIRPDARTLSDTLGHFDGEFVSSDETSDHDRRIVEVETVARFEAPEYLQAFEGFEEDLSALDLLFNVGPVAGRLVEASTRLETVEGTVKPGPAEEVG